MELEDRTLFSATPLPILDQLAQASTVQSGAAAATHSGSAAATPAGGNLADQFAYGVTQAEAAFTPGASSTSSVSSAAGATAQSAAATVYGSTPLAFEQNKGQTDTAVDYLAHGDGYLVYLSQGNAILSIADAEGNLHLVRLDLVGANPQSAVRGDGLQSGVSNYLYGKDANGWIVNVPHFSTVDYKNVYSGVDVQYHGSDQQRLEYDFGVAPGADASKIALRFDGAQSTTIEAGGNLEIELSSGTNLQFNAPIAYQQTATGRVIVESAYRLDSNGQVGFQLGAYDHNSPLVIDPVLSYGTYLGGTGADQAAGIAVDAAGNAYLTGQTQSANFPTTVGSYGLTLLGSGDVFVTKLNPTGTGLVYSTYIGGALGTQAGSAIAVDASGNAYVTGYTSSILFPTANAFQSGNSGGQDAFLLKLNSTGSSLLYSTYYGGSGTDTGNAIAVDSSGSAFIAGVTNSASGFASNKAYQSSLAGGTDAFWAEFDTTSSGAASRSYGTYLGGTGADGANAIGIDAGGEVYVAGYTKSNNFPTVGGISSTLNGGQDGFLSVFRSNNYKKLDYSTYVGGPGTDTVSAIAVPPSGPVYLAGSAANGLPTTAGAYQTTFGGGATDAFVWKVDPSQSGPAGLLYSTYLGGNKDDNGNALTIDAQGDVYLTGSTKGAFPVTASAVQATYGGDPTDAVVAVLDPGGAGLIYSTYLGGTKDDVGVGIALDAANNIYVAGTTKSTDFAETTAGAYSPSSGGGSDAFAVKITAAVAVNHAPVLSGANNLPAINENNVSSGGALVSSLLTGNVTDSDSGSRSGIAVTGVNNANGTWQYSTDGGDNWTSFGAPTQSTARLLAADASSYVRLVPNAGFYGTVTGLTFQAWDQTNWTAGGVADASLSGGSTAFSTAAATSSITVNFVNHAPQGTSGSVSTSVNTPYVFTTGNFGFSDPNDVPANALLAVRIATLPTSGVLTDNGAAVVAGQFISVSDISSGSLVYTPVPNSGGNASFKFQVQDDGGTANGGVDLDPTPNTLTINVVNHAPVLSGANNLPAINENNVTSGGALVSSLLAGKVTDSDPSSLSGIAVTGTVNTNGSWQYSTNGGANWSSFGTATQTTARLLAADASTYVRFVPNAGFFGTVTGLTFQAWDQTSGTAGAVANASLNGGSTAFSTAAATSSITVNFVNHAPQGSSGSVSTSVNTPYVFTTGNFGFSDPTDVPANALLAVRITTLPTLGVLTDNGTAVVAGQFIPVADISSGLLVYTPAANGSGSAYASFTFQVQDDGGTANGGTDLDPTPKTLTIDVLNHPPVLSGANNLPAINENNMTSSGALVSSLLAGKVTDSDPGALSGIAVTGVNNSNGAWQYSTDGGASWTSFGAPTQTTARLLSADASTYVRFVPNAGFYGTVTGLTFQAWDQTSGTAGAVANASLNGGSTAFSTGAATSSITVNFVNHAPQGTSGSVSTSVNTPYVFTTGTFGFSDPNDVPGNSLLAVQISTLPTAGVLKDNGVAVTAGQFITLADIGSGQLVYTPGPNGSGSAYASFTFQVQDNGGTANGGTDLDPTPKTLTIDVVNHAPVLSGANNLPAINENNVTSSGALVSSLLAGKVTDSDPGALSGIAVTGVNNTNGTWQYSTDGGASWTSFGAPTQTTARLLAADASTYVRFVPNANFNGTVTGLTFQAWDQTSGTAGGVADASLNGGPTPFSTAAATSSITVNFVNHAPQGTSGNVSTSVNTPYVFTAGNFGFSDPNDVPANTLLAVRITTLPILGVLKDNGTAVAAGQFVTLADISAGKLVYTPGPNGSGSAYASFTFQVQDNGGTANGGTDLDPIAKTLAIDVVNHAPVLSGANNLPGINENDVTSSGVRVSSLLSGNVTDTDPGSPSGIAVTAVDNTNGTWQYSTNGGANWTNFGAPTQTTAQLLAADANTFVRFVPNAGFSGTVSGLTFQAWDQTSGTAGGVADASSSGGATTFSAAAATSSITVYAPTAPILTGANNLTQIGVNPVINDGTLVRALIAGWYADSRPGNQPGIAVTAVDGRHGTWQYSLDAGATWQPFGAVSATQAVLLPADGNTYVRFMPAPDWTGTVAVGLQFRAWDQSVGVAGATFDTTAGGFAFSLASAGSGITVAGAGATPFLPSGPAANGSSAAVAARSTSAAAGTPIAQLPFVPPRIDPASAVSRPSARLPIGGAELSTSGAAEISRAANTILSTSDPLVQASELLAVIDKGLRVSSEPGSSRASAVTVLDASSLLWEDLGSLGAKLATEIHRNSLVVGSTLTVSAGLTVGYVIWLVRGGMLLSSFIAQMPAWRLIDPLVVLSRIDDELLGRETEDESLESIVNSGKETELQEAAC